MKRAFFWLLIVLVLGVGVVSAQGDLPTLSDLGAGWTQIPLPGAICARGTPYSFFVHPGDPAKLVVYFQGGGACWNAGTCKPGGTFDDSVDADELAAYHGIFDFDNPENPLADYSFVVIAYCTGDVHTGATSAEFTNGDQTFDIAFDGFTDAAAVLDWTYANYPAVDRLIVTGSSAGSIGAVFNAPYVLDHYREARALVFGDAYLGIIPDDWNGLQLWGTGANVPPLDAYANFTLDANFADQLYTALLQAFPNAVAAQYTSASDQIQMLYYLLQGGTMDEWTARRDANLAALDQLPNFRSYVGWGGIHTILALPLFYSMQVDGVRFRDWFADLVDGTPEASIRCSDCENKELYSAP